jgi:23S rRNA pseudouridine1911/1915/1917 synthase
VVARTGGGRTRSAGLARPADDDGDERHRAADEDEPERDDDDLESPLHLEFTWPMTKDEDAEGDGNGASAAPQRVTIADSEAGERLDRALASRLGTMSRSRLKQLILEGHVSRLGATISDPSWRVKPGESFLLAVPPPVADRPAPQAMALDIVYEDAHLIVIDKPAGLVVHPAPGNQDQTLVNALLAHCGEALVGIGGVKRPGIVHRLDKGTSGLMVVAKSEAAHVGLSADFAAHRIRRAYRAVVWGVPLPPRGTIEGPIGRSPVNRKKMAVVSRGGKQATTHYQVLREFRGLAAEVECRLATGRTHQIRVHLTERGHPLIGDPVYGSPRSAGRMRAAAPELRAYLAHFPRPALHAYQLGFEHPVSRQSLDFTSRLPNDITGLLGRLDQF